jgi:hypothetical protein
MKTNDWAKNPMKTGASFMAQEDREEGLRAIPSAGKTEVYLILSRR